MAEAKKDNSIVLVSADGAEFTVNEEEAFCSKLIRRMIENDTFIESKTRRIELPLISKDVLEVIIKYFKFRLQYQNSKERPPEFPIEPKLLIDVLKGANYLDC